MICPNCKNQDSRNIWMCLKCGEPIEGGIVFVTGISGSGVKERVQEVVVEAERHNHKVMVHDIGQLMFEYATEDDPNNVQWDRILNMEEKFRIMLRNRAFERVANDLKDNPDTLHIVDTHLSFRWQVYLTRGIEPHVLRNFEPYTRCFVTVVEDITKVRERLRNTQWGDRENLELLIWREEELFLADLLKEVCGRVNNYAVAAAEPPTEIEKIIWHPEIKKVYLSFPITNILNDESARGEIERFRDKIREFLVVFDPYALKDYDDTYRRAEMQQVRKQVGAATEQRDYRFIDQAEAVVVYFPKKVDSKGVDAEMRHAYLTGKKIYLYCPDELGGGPFAGKPDFYSNDPDEFINLLRTELLHN